MRRVGIFVWAGGVALALVVSCGGRPLGSSPDAGGQPDAGDQATDGAREVAAERTPALTPAEAALAKLQEAGFVRGLNVCRCGLPGFSDDQLTACAQEESGTAMLLFDPDARRCASELARDSAEVRAFVECEAARITKLASCEAGGCPGNPGCAISEPCPIPREQAEAWARCREAFYCGDVRADEMRCNGVVECGDGLDERGCANRSN